MSIKILPRIVDGEKTRPAILLSTARRYVIIRFGREQHVAWTERDQGTGTLPVNWHYAFGQRLSVKYVNMAAARA